MLNLGCLIVALFTLSSGAFAANPKLQADRANVNADCKQEAQTAGCGNEVVGTGLRECIHTYKKNHKKDFQISAGCKTALETLKTDKAAAKAAAGAPTTTAPGTH